MAVLAPPSEQMTRQTRPDTAVPAHRSNPVAWRGKQFLSRLVPVLLVLAWEMFARLGKLPPYILPAPTKVVATGIALIQDGMLIPDMGISLLRTAVGFAIGGFIGFALGTAVGFSRIAGVLLDRTILMLRAIPFLAVLPLVIVWLGIGEGAKIFLVAFGVVFPIYMNIVLGIRQVDPKLVELGRVTGLSNQELIRYVILPGAATDPLSSREI
jgi:sulfonate transport system permease protein